MAIRVTAANVATGYTREFVLKSLRPGAQDLLEVGCGAGELAAVLAADGFNVVAIDSDRRCVDEACSRGVNARHAIWPSDPGGRFDAVLFTRSLHHVDDLSASVAGAKHALRPQGRVIVEDFRAEGGTERSARWYETMVCQLIEEGAFTDCTESAVLLEKIAPDRHEHELHSSAAIEMALRQSLAVAAGDAAYYFRYFEPHLRHQDTAARILQVELEQIATGSIDPLGKRFVASH